MAGPGYSVKDAYEYGGFILGAAVAGLVAREQGWHQNRITFLIAVVIAGFICGFIGNRIYEASHGHRSPFDNDPPPPPPPS